MAFRTVKYGYELADYKSLPSKTINEILLFFNEHSDVFKNFHKGGLRCGKLFNGANSYLIKGNEVYLVTIIGLIDEKIHGWLTLGDKRVCYFTANKVSDLKNLLK